ncbi:hypothetical protein [Marinobacterium litorale]|uniref:hypothetical protein n=1 Tax=Marinobacterium litorale TaxID=404770 RepID=UPI000420DA42|nr:hypothetical protein [Marinobacterium litorale]
MIANQDNAEWISAIQTQEAGDSDWVKGKLEITHTPIPVDKTGWTATEIYTNEPLGTLLSQIGTTDYYELDQDATKIRLSQDSVIGTLKGGITDVSPSPRNLTTYSGGWLSLDGTKLYFMYGTGINEISLNTPGILSDGFSGGYTQIVTFSSGSIMSVFPNKDHTSVYAMVSDSSVFYIRKYELGTAGDFSTLPASPTSYMDLTGIFTTAPKSFCVSTEEDFIYVIGNGSVRSIVSYSLSTAGDLSSNSFNYETTITSYTYDYATLLPDGMTIAAIQSGNHYLYLIKGVGVNDFSTATVEATANYISEEQDLVSVIYDYATNKVMFSGYQVDKFFTTDEFLHLSFNSNAVLDFTISTEVGADYISAGDFSGLTVSPDGTSAYTISTTYDRVHNLYNGNDFDFSSSSMSYVSTSSYTPNPKGIFVNNAGTHAYIVDTSYDKVFHFILSGWGTDFPTSPVGDVSVSSQEPTPYCVFLSNDGKHLFVGGATTKRLYRYSLTTPWYPENGITLVDDFGPFPSIIKNGYLLVGDTTMVLCTDDTFYLYSLPAVADISNPTLIRSETVPAPVVMSPSGDKSIRMSGSYIRTCAYSEAAWGYYSEKYSHPDTSKIAYQAPPSGEIGVGNNGTIEKYLASNWQGHTLQPSGDMLSYSDEVEFSDVGDTYRDVTIKINGDSGQEVTKAQLNLWKATA